MAKNRRNSTKYPGLDKKYNLKIRADCFDQDYIDKLSEKEKEWLNRFNEEYIGGNFKHEGKILHKGKKKKRAIWRDNNRRNNDEFAIAKMNRKLTGDKDIKTVLEKPKLSASQYEDIIIDLIDIKKASKRNER